MGGFMQKNQKTEITVKAFYDGELDATEVFMNLIAQKINWTQKHFAIHHSIAYNKFEHQNSRLPSGLCR